MGKSTELSGKNSSNDFNRCACRIIITKKDLT